MINPHGFERVVYSANIFTGDLVGCWRWKDSWQKKETSTTVSSYTRSCLRRFRFNRPAVTQTICILTRRASSGKRTIRSNRGITGEQDRFSKT